MLSKLELVRLLRVRAQTQLAWARFQQLSKGSCLEGSALGFLQSLVPSGTACFPAVVFKGRCAALPFFVGLTGGGGLSPAWFSTVC